MTEVNYDDRIEFIPDAQVLEVDFSNFSFTDSKVVHAFYDVIDEKLKASGQKWYFMVNYKNCTIMPEAWMAFANRGKKANLGYSLGTVRYDTPDETEETILEKARQENFEANVFSSRDDALERLAEMRSSANAA